MATLSYFEYKGYTMRKVYLAACLVGSIFLACTKDPYLSHSRADIMSCIKNKDWDSNITGEALIGDWEWIYVSCISAPEIDHDDQYKGLSIKFNSDMTLEVKQDGQVTQTSSWNLMRSDTEYVVIEVDPPVIQLYGRIFICDDLVEFSNSSSDGCNNYFKRKS